MHSFLANQSRVSVLLLLLLKNLNNCWISFQVVDKVKAMIEADNNRSFVVDVFDAGSNKKVLD